MPATLRSRSYLLRICLRFRLNNWWKTRWMRHSEIWRDSSLCCSECPKSRRCCDTESLEIACPSQRLGKAFWPSALVGLRSETEHLSLWRSLSLFWAVASEFWGYRPSQFAPLIETIECSEKISWCQRNSQSEPHPCNRRFTSRPYAILGASS